MSSNTLKEIQAEFEEFQSGPPAPPSVEISSRILYQAHHDLHPSFLKVFGLLALVHLVSSILTLSLCAQFDYRIFGSGPGLMKYFMIFGEYGCLAACGAFYIGTSLLIGALILKPEEIRMLRRHRALQLVTLTALSLGALIMLNATVVLGLAIAWFLGCVLGGLAMLELGWRLRLQRLAA